MADNSSLTGEPATSGETDLRQQMAAIIRYKVECDDQFGPKFECKQDAPFDLQVSQNSSAQVDVREPVFEIITALDVASNRPKYYGNVWGMQLSHEQRVSLMAQAEERAEERSEPENKKPTLEDKRILRIGGTRMDIHSPWLLEAIREVVEFYPSQNLTGDTVTVHEPYCALVHYITELRDLKNRLSLDRVTEPDQEPDDLSVKYEHLRVLLEFLDPHVERLILPARRRLKKETPTTTFEDLWYLLRPGTLSYCTHDSTLLGCAIESATLVEDKEKETKKWTVKVWFLGHRWKTARMRRALVEIEVPYFEGEKSVVELPVYPRDYFDNTDGGERREKFQKRGAKACAISWDGPSFLSYKGNFMDKDGQEYNGPIVAETHILRREKAPENKWEFSWDSSLEYATPRSLEKAKDLKYMKPVGIDPKRLSRDLLSDDHLFLVSPVMIAFALNIKSWMPVHVDYMHDIGPPDYVPDANIGASNLRIIRALSHRQVSTKPSWSADFIKNKGEGVVVLLHGPPGVGKTYTVEKTAVSTRRPLVALTLGDLGKSEEQVEKELTKWFDLAHRWRAILLIDEADIFLERRKHTDLARNGVVAAFLRKMEYFGGLLFLTTNRVEHIDEAFMSRVHVVIGFNQLDREKRRVIWESFIDKLKREMEGKIRISPEAEAFVLDDDEMGSVEWNGREIRNAFQTAISLAEFEATEDQERGEEEETVVGVEHFRQIMEMSRTFKDHVDTVRKENDSEWSDL
ncbi:ATPAse AAA+ type core protein [Neofusicoccum parvum]|nr:ATPAse AAA+ type core protein [Neofusicoccum parvum]